MEALYTDDQIFIPIISDYGFKATFGNESNTLFLRRALQALIKSEVPIKKVTFDKTTFEGITLDSRSGIYDVACIDENGNHFIVEMQYGEAPHFIQRMKFYAMQKLNIMVKKGDFDYAKLSKIYCVSFLAKNILPYPSYHTVANLRSEKGELIDEQMTFVTVELDKFKLKEKDCRTDIEKLTYTMKTIHTVTQPTEFPKFWNEKWLKIAIDELDRRKMTAEQRASFEILIARNAEAVKAEQRRIEEAENRKAFEFVKSLLTKTKHTLEEIADIAGTTINFVLEVQRQLSAN
jgi:predicted transposase/invertase (TIGR01784 family)